MELLIVAGVGALGYALTRPAIAPAAQTQRTKKSSTHQQQQQPLASTMLQADRAFAQNRWEQSLDPRITGIITPGTQPSSWLPFFKSERAQNTNDRVKQERMELFTGATMSSTSATGTYRHKQEVPALFSPSQSAMPVDSSGASNNLQLDTQALRQRMGLTSMQNNIRPTAQIRVGPGLGVGPNVVATGGFHDMYRVLPTPDSLGSYRKNPLPGTINAGANPIENRTATVDVKSQRPQRFWSEAERPPGPGQAAVLAQTSQPQINVSVGRLVGSASNPGGPGVQVDAGYVPADNVRVRSDQNPGFELTNVASAVPGTTAPRNYDSNRFTKLHREVRGGQGVLTQVGPSAPSADPGLDMTQTMRGTALNYVASGTGTTQPTSMPDTASSMVLRAHPESFGTGPSNAANPGGMSVMSVDTNRQRKMVDIGYVTNPERVNDFQGAASLGEVGLRSGEQVTPAITGGKDLVGTFVPVIGKVRTDLNRLPSVNPLLSDLGLAKQQLQNNPLSMTIN